MRCRRCSLGYLSPRPASTTDIYADPAYFNGAEGTGYLAYAEDSNVMQAYFARIAHDLAETVGQGRLLEVGSANGSFLRVARAPDSTCRAWSPVTPPRRSHATPASR